MVCQVQMDLRQRRTHTQQALKGRSIVGKLFGKFKNTAHGVAGVEVTTGDGHTLVSAIGSSGIIYVRPTRAGEPEVASNLIENQSELGRQLVALSDAGVVVRGEVKLFEGDHQLPAGSLEVTEDDVSVVVTDIGTPDVGVHVVNRFTQSWEDYSSGSSELNADIEDARQQVEWRNAMCESELFNKTPTRTVFIDDMNTDPSPTGGFSDLSVSGADGRPVNFVYNHDTQNLSVEVDGQMVTDLDEKEAVQHELFYTTDLGAVFREMTVKQAEAANVRRASQLPT